jgi:hypothetical protein
LAGNNLENGQFQGHYPDDHLTMHQINYLSIITIAPDA